MEGDLFSSAEGNMRMVNHFFSESYHLFIKSKQKHFKKKLKNDLF